MERVKKINYVFLFTVLILMISSSGIIPFARFVNSYTGLLIISQIIIVIPSLIYLMKNRLNYKEAVRLKKVRPINVFLLVVFTFLILPVMNFVNALSQLFAVNTTTEVMNSITSNSPFIIGLFTIAFVPCILEESVYRGVFYNEYSKHNKIGAIFLSAFLFGILHGNFNQFSYAFVMGIVFALVIEATDSIVSTMIIHFIINGNSVVLLYLYPKMMSFLEGLYNSAVEKGDLAMISRIENVVGGNNFDPNALIQSASTAELTFSQIVTSYGITALVCGLLAFLVYRSIAKNAGRWDNIKGIFIKKNHQEQNNDVERYYSREWEDVLIREEDEKQERFFTLKNLNIFIPLYIAMAISIFSMILNELYARGIISI